MNMNEERCELTEESLGAVSGGGVDWQVFGDCVLQLGGSTDPQLAELVFAIMANNTMEVRRLALTASIAANPIVARSLQMAS